MVKNSLSTFLLYDVDANNSLVSFVAKIVPEVYRSLFLLVDETRTDFYTYIYCRSGNRFKGKI